MIRHFFAILLVALCFPIGMAAYEIGHDLGDATRETTEVTVRVTQVKRGEVIVTEQFLDEGGPLDVRQPAILSYWPDLSRDDGTVGAAIFRCQNQGGEMIAEFLEGDWSYKCEDVDY